MTIVVAVQPVQIKLWSVFSISILRKSDTERKRVRDYITLTLFILQFGVCLLTGSQKLLNVSQKAERLISTDQNTTLKT